MQFVLNDEELLNLLIKNKLTSQVAIDKFKKNAETKNASLYEVILDAGIISEEELGRLVADFIKCQFTVLSHHSIDLEILNIIPELYAKKHRVIAFNLDKKGLHVAMENPKSIDVVKYLEKKVGMPVVVYLSTGSDISESLMQYIKGVEEAFDEIIDKYVKQTEEKSDIEPPIVKIVDTIVEYAFRNKASDIHIEAQDENTLVRFRMDGILHDVVKLPAKLHSNIVTRIKVMSNLRTDDHSSPQDGKIRFNVEDQQIDLRVSIVPSIDGEKVVIRLLIKDTRRLSLKDLGFSEQDLINVEKAYKKPHGMVLSTGPTGSGKTTTMYSILRILNKREVNISTIEDPVEYDLQGITQIQVSQTTKLTFANGLRSLLRQDPDIVLVGEIRDEETAHIAVNASMTGHLVLSTLHTNDAATTIVRFLEMKVEPFMIASTLNLIVAQRLVRKICTQCRVSEEVTVSDLKKRYASAESVIMPHLKGKKSVRVYHGKGCAICHDTGYDGRIGVYEVMPIEENLREAMISRKTTSEIKMMAVKNGMTTMLDDGMVKVFQGLTSIEEVIRVLTE